MLAASSRKHIARAGRLGSGPALGPQSMHCGHRQSSVVPVFQRFAKRRQPRRHRLRPYRVAVP